MNPAPGDAAIVLAMVMTSAAWIVLHVSLAWAVLWRGGWLRALLGLVLVPVAPVVGYRTGVRVRSVLWVMFAAGYGALRWRYG